MDNYYTNVRRNSIPGPTSSRPMAVGEPIETSLGKGIITNIKRVYGGLEKGKTSVLNGIIISVLFPGQVQSIDFATTDMVYQSKGGGQMTIQDRQN